MVRHIRLVAFALLLTIVAGCFPVFVPVGDGHRDGRGGDDHHDGGRGGGGDERHGDRH
jgi:hypothetical protein